MDSEFAENVGATIEGLIDAAAESLNHSFKMYWPADDRNDPAERNVSLHFAHAMLSQGFACFAEADHPDRKKVLGIDVFGIAPGRDWFLGCEFKRLFRPDRLLSYRSREFPPTCSGYGRRRNMARTPVSTRPRPSSCERPARRWLHQDK